MQRFLRLLALTAAFVAGNAGAAFHLIAINEIYSNASGTVQYVELTALAGGQQFVSGHTLVSTNGSITVTVPVTRDLPGDTGGGKRMLFGTVGVFTAFGIVPDYILPDGFIFQGGGTLNWGEGSDVWTHPGLPQNGQALGRQGNAEVTTTPQNFAGVIGMPSTPAASTFQALWWASPGGSESGWGVNIAHQGNTLFATWFTYDTNGDGLWLVMDNGARQGTSNTFTGPLYRTTGPAFSAVPFNPANVMVTQVGTGTFTFSSATAGTFAYTVNGISQTKNIVRQEFSSPVPTCTAGGTLGSLNYQDLWWRSPAASESGWGLNLIHQGNIIFATWFTYAANGTGQWLVMDNLARQGTSETFTGQILRTRGNAFNSTPWNTGSITASVVGTATLTFTGSNAGTFAYTLDGVSQTKPITRQNFAAPVSVCQ